MIKGLLCFFLLAFGSLQSFEKVIIWGHTLHSHTHSYIHMGFYKAFEHLGYEVHWLDENSDVSQLELANTLFITEGQADKNIPIRDDCFYLLHNIRKNEKYRDLYRQRKACGLQVYTSDVLDRKTAKMVAPGTFYDLEGKFLYIPWATDLLPDEIDAIKKEMPSWELQNQVCFLGTIKPGYHGNRNEFKKYFAEARKAGMEEVSTFTEGKQVQQSRYISLIQQAKLAPVLMCRFQVEKGYIPCRIFKNISYGKMGITNSRAVWEFFDRKIVYHKDPAQLFHESMKALETYTLEDQYALMDFVRDHHTFINRVKTIEDFIEKFQEYWAI